MELELIKTISEMELWVRFLIVISQVVVFGIGAIIFKAASEYDCQDGFYNNFMLVFLGFTGAAIILVSFLGCLIVGFSLALMVAIDSNRGMEYQVI